MDVGAYGLSRNPFERNPELDETCLPNPLAVLLSELQAGMRSPQGVSVLVGERNCGKSMLAKIFARRLAGHTRAALSTAPGPSLADVFAESLAQLSGEDVETRDESRLLHELGILVQRRARAGSASAIVIDDAQRLSPQVLAGLSRMFPDDSDEPLHFHLFLIGRPDLLDRMNASADRLLLEHLLQICRIEPLGLRDSVRYLERRLAACGGELLLLFETEAIDEIVALADGRLLELEALAASAFENAARSGAARVTTAHVRKLPPVSASEEESVAPKQQSLGFEFADDRVRDDSDWSDEEDEESDDEWVAGDEPGADEPGLYWDANEIYEDEQYRPELECETRSVSSVERAPRRGLAGMAVVTAAVLLAMIWMVKRLPGDAAQPSGRDALLFAQPLSSQPREILRLAGSNERADAADHVAAWNNAKAAAARAEPRAVAAAVAKTVATADSAGATAKSDARPVATAEKSDARSAGAGAKSQASRSARVQTASLAAPKTVQRSEPRGSAKVTRGPVYTVQVGAFRTRRNAQELISKLGPSLARARILSEGGFYRVVSGSFDNKMAAVAHEGSLKRAGLTTYVRTATF